MNAAVEAQKAASLAILGGKGVLTLLLTRFVKNCIAVHHGADVTTRANKRPRAVAD